MDFEILRYPALAWFFLAFLLELLACHYMFFTASNQRFHGAKRFGGIIALSFASIANLYTGVEVYFNPNLTAVVMTKLLLSFGIGGIVFWLVWTNYAKATRPDV